MYERRLAAVAMAPAGWRLWLWLWLGLVLGTALSGADAREPLRAPAAFELESTLQLNDAARADREVGYKLRARLLLAPRWADGDDLLLHFHLSSPKLYLRGKHPNADFMPYESVWDSVGDSTFYAHWSRGQIKSAYLDLDELPDVLNYKKSLISLFQIQTLDGEYNETDVSGSCLVLYETISSEVFRKIKRECAGDGEGGVSGARRVTRYTRAGEGGELSALHAEELLLLGHAALGVKARSWHSLRRAGDTAAAPAPPPAPSLGAALQALPSALRAAPLALQPTPDDAEDEEEELSAALAASEAALGGAGAGEGGAAGDAAAALRLLPALRRASTEAALALLRRAEPQHQLPGVCRMLGLAATRATHAAADDFLQLRAREPLLELARAYLSALALAAAPDEAVVLDVLRLGEEARAPGVRAAALLAGAGAARARPAAGAARDVLARGLARCKDAPCRALRLRALASLRCADCADLLLAHAERAEPAPALAALAALDALAPAALTFARLERLQALALRGDAALEVRAAALDLLVRRRADVPTPLARVAYALHARGEHELQRVLWQRVAALAPTHVELGALRGRLEPALRGWEAAALGGTSSVLVRAPGWAAGGWHAQLQSLQVARAGLLRRGEVRLLALSDAGDSFEALTVEVVTRGLEAFGGSGDADAAEEPSGVLALAVGGARLPDIPLFDGQAELLGHVWAGTASSATPVLRALQPLHDTRRTVPLLGGVRARLHVRAALALALDAQAQVSLWWRSARAELALRAGLAAATEVRVRTRWSELSARADVRASPRLRIAADLDFYSGVALCVRVSTDEHALARNVTLTAQGGARRLRVRRARAWRRAAPGRTLALGRHNDATCCTLRAADADAPEN